MKDEKIEDLAEDFKNNKDILSALGNENRQRIIVEMMKYGDCEGIRVNELSKRVHLSRPAVSGHIKILKDADIVKLRRDGTKNFYYFNKDMKAFKSLISLFEKSVSIGESFKE